MNYIVSTKALKPARFPAIMAISLLLCVSATAALKTWDGSSGANWSTAANWTPSGVPLDGDDLSFPAGALNPVNNNDIVDLRVATLQFSGAAGGFTLSGNAITITNGVVAANTAGLNILSFSTITNATSQTWTVDSGGTLDVNANIVLIGGGTFTVNNDFNVTLDGTISGSGALLKSSSGTGTLFLRSSANNTYTGTTTVNAGILNLNSSASATAMVPGDLVINANGTVTLGQSSQIADTSDVTVNGVLSLGGFSETIATLTMTAGDVSTGAGTLTCGNITTFGSSLSSTIAGNLFLGTATRTISVADGTSTTDLIISAVISGGTSGSPLFIPAGFTKTGAGTLVLSGANTYGGPTTVNDGIVDLQNNLGLGGTVAPLVGSAATFVNSNAVLLLRNAHVTNEVLTLNSLNSGGALQVELTGDWIGDITLSTNVVIEASSLLQLGGVISGTGGFTKVGGSTLRMIGADANTYAGTTTVNSGTLELGRTSFDGSVPGPLVIGDGSLVDSVVLLAGSQIANTAPVTLNPGALLNLNNFVERVASLDMTAATVDSGLSTLFLNSGGVTTHASATGSTILGHLDLGGGVRVFDIASGVAAPDLLVSAVVSGGGVTKNGGGNLQFSGANTYAGLTTINDGFIIITQPTGLGTSAAGAVLSGTGALSLVGVTVTSETLTNNSSSTILQASGVSGWGSNVVLNADLQIQSLSGTFDISGAISGTGGLTKELSGTLRFSGSSANNYDGPTTVNEGVLELAKASAINSSSLLTIGDGVGGVGADIVRYFASNPVNSAVPIRILDSGLLDMNGFSDSLGVLTLIGGDITTGVGTLSMSGNLFATSTSAGGSANISGILNLGASTRTFTVTNGPITPDLTISAQVIGTGGIIKAEGGMMSLQNSNTFSGAVTVNDGALRGTDNFSFGTTAGGVTVNGAAGLQLSSAHIGDEALTLNTSNTLGFQPLAGSNSWAGTVTVQGTAYLSPNLAGDSCTLLGKITGPGAVIKSAAGTLYFSGSLANDYAGVTTVNSGTLVLNKTVANGAMTNNLIIGDGVGGANADVVRTEVTSQLPNTVAVTLNSSGQLILNVDEAFGSLAGSGNVVVNTSASLGADPGFDNSSTTFSGVISGTGGLNKNGTGTMTLTGNSTYTGDTSVNAGKLVVNGSQPQSPVTVGATGILGGSGIVGVIVNTVGGVVAPGASPGILTCSSVNFSGVNSDFTVELSGPIAGSGYDQLNVQGTNNLGGATLNVNAAFGLSNAPAIGQQFTILNNDGVDAITGTFSGRPNNSTFTVDNLTFVINYNGGIGANDVVLTLTNAGGKVVGTAILSGNGNGLIDPNECNLLNVVVSNSTANPMTGISAKLSSLTPGVTVHQTVVGYPDIPANGRRTNSSPFQLSIGTNFVCGQNVDLLLSLETTSHNAFGLPVTLNSGAVGTTLRFTNSTATAIPDGGTINPVLAVSGLTAPIAKVTVEMNLIYPQDQDIDVTLEAPDGTLIELTTDNGGTGGAYGAASCSSSTVFDDAAGTAITAGVAPFVGTFRPEGSLATLIGKSPGTMNGNWILHVTDDNLNGFTGTLHCWKLNVSQATCAPGGGACETCTDITLAGAVGLNDPSTDRLTRDGIPSACGLPKTCPGPFGDVEPYTIHTFRNGPANACISVSLQAPLTTDVFSAAYLGAFNPPNACTNYLADGGNSTFPAGSAPSYSFNVPANAVFTIAVNSIFGATGPYTLTVSGGGCRPVLNIGTIGNNQAVLDWTTADAGYRLERTNALPSISNSWQSVPAVPTVVNGRFTVTNSVNSSSQFYRLVKP